MLVSMLAVVLVSLNQVQILNFFTKLVRIMFPGTFYLILQGFIALDLRAVHQYTTTSYIRHCRLQIRQPTVKEACLLVGE